MDQKYWENYYLSHGNDEGIKKHSSFSEFCHKNFFLEKKLNIVEIGSGNGRDAIYFAHQNHKVIAIDQSTTAIDIERKNISSEINNNLFPMAENFVNYDFKLHDDIDVFYSRFTIHAISKQDEDVLLPHIYNSLTKGGIFCVEVRTTKDPLFGVGEYCGDNTYRTDHSRRFIDSNIFLKNVLSLGFYLLYFIEKNDLSVYKGDNPVLMRIILKKV